MAAELSIDDEISDDLATWRSRRLPRLVKGEATQAERAEAISEFDAIARRQQRHASEMRVFRAIEKRGATPHTVSLAKSALGIR